MGAIQIETALEVKPLKEWRVGTKMPINIYEGDRPICQCHTVLDGKRIVEAVNGTARAAREREWIPISEQMPELARKVIIYRDGSVCEGEYQGKFGWHVWATWRQDVTHWMPLPDPPEAALSETQPQEKP